MPLRTRKSSSNSNCPFAGWRPLERRANDCDGNREITEDQRGVETNDAIAEPSELAITARIRCPTAGVIAAIDLNDELDARRAEISNEAGTHRDLATKANAELTCVERRPQASFRLSEAAAMLPSGELQPSCGSRLQQSARRHQ